MPGVTKEQIQAAREADLFTYLQFHEPGVLKRDGPNFRHKEHDSLVYVTGKRYWYWNSRGRSINALDYLIQIRGYGLVDAVHALVGGEIRHTPAYRSTAEIQVSKEPEKKAFSLPWARRCATAAVSYLQKRGISSEVIRQCLQAGIFYEARYHGEPVCVFVGKDDSGKAKFACMRSIGGNLKKDVYGSDKGYNFCYPPQSPGNCDASLFLGGKEETTLKSWNSLLGKETIDLYNTSVTKGNQESHGQNFQKLGKDLMSVDELAVMDGGKCLLQIRGVRPFLSRKYDITKHPNYKLLSDFNEKNAFNIEKFLSTRMPMRPGERYRNYEVTAEDLASQTL